MTEGNMGMKDEEEEQENYIGRTVKKFFLGFGYFHGKVIAFNRAHKFYKVKYDDGDREELDLKELKEVLVDNQQPLSAAEKPKSSRRGRKRRRDSTDKDGASGAGRSTDVGERQYDNALCKNSSRKEMAEQFSTFKLEEVTVLNAQTQEIYRQLRGDRNVEGKDGRPQGDELLLEPLVPVCLVDAFEKSVKQAESAFEDHGEDEERVVGACGDPVLPVDGSPPCRLKRTRVSPTSDTYLQQMPPASQEEIAARNEEVATVNMEEQAVTMVDAALPPVATEADSPGSDLDNKNSDTGEEGGRVGDEGKTQFSAFVLSLPPSSRSLGALDDCVAEFFEVYTMLRSFSSMIFLSPFSLKEFAYALISTDVCSLIDCIHLSLMQSLRRQLERLSKNGSKSSTFTLRLSDWSLLDYMTWPSFLMGYMLTQGFSFDAGNSDVKAGLTAGEYYKLPVRTKLVILSYLCDKVLDTDEARAELARRIILENDPETMESRGFARKKQVKDIAHDVVEIDHDRPGTVKDEVSVQGVVQDTLSLSPSAASSIRVGRHLDEDGNLDECVLCAMDGNLICCDGCPAAYHSRCVGVSKQGLPPGDWFCPECRTDKHDPRGAAISKGIRGGELLAIGPDKQVFYNICGYLLISESGPNGQFMHRYYSPRDLQTVVNLLEEAGPNYAHVEDAARQLCQVGLRGTMATHAQPKPAVSEAPPSLDTSAKKEAGQHDVQNPSSSLLGGELPAKAEKPVPSFDSLTLDQKSQFAISYQSTIANCESLPSSLTLPPKEQHEEKPNLHVDDLNQTNGLLGGECLLSVEKSLPISDLTIAELTKKSESAVSNLSTAIANCESLRNPVSFDRNGEQKEQQNLRVTESSNQVNGPQAATDGVGHVTGEAKKKSVVLGAQPKKPGHDELSCNISDNSLTSELENIWRQHTFGHPKDLIVHSINGHNRQVTVEVDSCAGGRAVAGMNGTLMNVSGDVEEGKIISLGMVQPVRDLTVKAIGDSPGGPFSEQRDVCASIVKRADAQYGSSDKEVDYLSTITQINACSYTNKYANCDLVATSAFNLAVMAGGLDDLVDDKSGSMKKPKPSSVADQQRAFTQASSHFYWPSVKKRAKDVPKEKCGWCINCRSTGRRGCLLTQIAGQIAGGAALVVGGIRPIKGGPGHFPAVAAYILYMEENLHGLLVGQWEFRGHRKKWRKQVEQATSLTDVKLALLQMESSMRKVLLSSDWEKVEEDAPESIASSGVIISTVASTGKKATPTKKRGRHHVVTKAPAVASYDGSCFGVKWWRGGRLSRKVYNWESLTRTALRRAGRQGGFKEIPELVYSKSLDLPRRSRRLAWRTRLEKISSIAHVAVEVRYLDTFIKWNDIISPLEASTTHIVKTPAESDPAFHKADIRTKKEESGEVKYLLGFPSDTDDKTDAQQQQELPPKGVGSLVEKSSSRKNHANPKVDGDEVWVTESQVPLFLLKAFVEKTRAENQSEMPKSLKQDKLKGPNLQNKLSFWKMLCSPRLSGVLESKKKVSGWACGHCKLNGSESQRVRCQRCSGDFHRSCAHVDGSINGQEKFVVCNNCIQLRLGHRMRKPSYKMLVMQSELSNGKPNEVLVSNMDGPSAGSVKLRLKKARRADSTSPPDFELFGRRKKKKRLLSMPTPSQLNSDYPWIEEKQGKRKKMKKKKGFTTVFPYQYEGDPNLVGKKKKRKKAIHLVEETDLPQPKKKRGRKKKIISLVPSQGEPSQERRTSGRIRNNISPNTAISISVSGYQSPKRVRTKHKLDKELSQPEKAVSTRRRRGLMKDTLAAAENDDGEDQVAIKPSLKRKRLKIIFDGLEIAGTDRSNSLGREDGPFKRKSTNGLDFGCRSIRLEPDIQKFRRERVVFEDQVVLDIEKLPKCGICSEPYAPGQVYVSCEYCDGWYHGVAVGLRPGDAAHLVGYKCHRCRKCRAPPCPIRQNNSGVKTRRRGTIDHGEVIDAENVKRTGQCESVSLQSSWFNSPDKEFSAFSDSKALPDFVSATNQAEEALAADGSNFGHDVLSHDFDISDLVLAGDSQVQLNPLLGDQQVNEWANSGVSQLGLPTFSVSQADLSSQGAPSLSFTELLASEDDLFAGVTGTGLVLSAEWSGEMYGSDALGPLQPSGITSNGRGDNYLPLVNANGNMSASSALMTTVKIPTAEITTNTVMDNYSTLVTANGNLSISVDHAPPLKSLADITTNAVINRYANGYACQTTLPSEQFRNSSYHRPIEPLPVMTGVSGNTMNRDGPSAASR